MSALVPCPVCHSENSPDARVCWICGDPLPKVSSSAEGIESAVGTEHAREEEPAPAVDSASARSAGLSPLAWLITAGGVSLITLVVGIEISLNWPGLLVPYAFVMMLVFAATAMTGLVLWGARKGAAGGGLSSTPAHDVEVPVGARISELQPPSAELASARKNRTLSQDVAMGLGIAFAMIVAIVGALSLLAVAAIVVFALLCMGLIAGA